ncbi:hypothetical protein FO519_008250 [Halicephalobus sp. NKZ332]|nr:hypothetical protein FO519_008250 [Halicephalobus sp. NKZ332]
MDTVIGKLSSHPEAKNVNNLNELAILAKGLSSKNDMPSVEKRKRLFALFETILASGKPKLAYHAIEGLQLLLRDSTFNSDSDAKKDEERTVAQTISHLSSLPSWDRQIQCQVITVLVQAISSTEVKVHLADVYAALKVCSTTYSGSDEASVKLAVRAALTQLLNSYCINRYSSTSPDSQEEILVLMDMTTLVKELLLKLDNGQQAVIEDLQLGLDALASVVSVQPPHFYKHLPLLTLFTTELIPSLLCLLQTAGEKREKTKNFLGMTRSNSSKSSKITIFSNGDIARSFYQLVEHLLKLMAPLQTNRSLTIELFRAAMVVPPPEKRYEPLKLLKRFTTTPPLFSSLLNLMILDDSIWPVVVECIEESAKQTISTDVSVDAIKTLQIMFDAFDSIGDKFEQLHFDEGFFDKIKLINTEERSKNQRESDGDEKDNTSVDPKITNSAAIFVEKIQSKIDEWLDFEDPTKLDLEIQRFAADFVKENEENQKLLNPDAAYLSVYASLSFSLGILDGISLSRSNFIKMIQCEGCVVYVNDFFVLSLYRIIQKNHFFDGKDLKGKTVLEGIIQDFDGRKNKLLIYQPIKKSEDDDSDPIILEEREFETEEMKELDFWMNRILSNCWGTVQTILSRFPLKSDKKSEKFSVEGAEATLEAMKSFSRILKHYSMKREILWLFEKFGEEICNLEELRDFVNSNTEKKSWTMTRIDALGLDLIFENSLVSATISPGCWKYVVRAIEYVAEMERHQFNLLKSANTAYEGSTEGLKDLLGHPNQKDLNLKTTGKVLDELMLKIHRLFENAAQKLNLENLCQLLDFLVGANENNLKYSENKRISETCSLIQRISRLVVDSSNRPKIHLMKIWSIVYLHLSEASGARFPEEISRLAVVSLSDCTRSFLKEETPGFCFHQALFQVFQNMLCSDSCAEETQEHIVSILCSFIQDRPKQIGSGWKPLFGAVKAIRISSSKDRKSDSSQPRLSIVHFAVLEVLKRYFEIDDPQVFVQTALEFFSCVSHYLQSTAESKQNVDGEVSHGEEQDAAIAETVFSFVLLAQQLLVEYFSSEDVVPSPNLINKLKMREKNLDIVEDNYNAKFADLPPLTNCLREEPQLGVYPRELNESLKRPVETFPWKTMSESEQSIIELILSLIESLSGLVLTCTRQIQTKLISSLSEFISGFRSNAIGADIGSFSLCFLIFPIFQKWAFQEKASGFSLSPESAKSIRSLKQASGILTQVVVEYVLEKPEADWSEKLLLDCHHLMDSFVAHPSQAISGIGTACLRHLISSTSEKYSEKLWKITGLSLWRANSITLAPVRRLCFHYFVDSTDFGGDIGEVSVGVRKEETDKDHVELQLMARQIFSIDENQSIQSAGNLRTSRSVTETSVPQTPISPAPSQKQLAYVFKLTKAGSEPLNLSLEDLVTSLLNQQVLIQLISGILLGEQTTNLASGVSTAKTETNDSGFIGKAPEKTLGALLHCLDASAAVATLFDERPALKMLIQKICNLEQSANLYKCMISSQSVKLMSVYQIAKLGKDDYLKTLGSSLLNLLDQLRKYDQEAAKNKLASFARDRIDQKIQISLIENNEKNENELKSFSVVSAAKCLEEYKKQKRMDSLPSKSVRSNPFVSRLDSNPNLTISPEKLQLSQLNDLDVRILAFSEVIAQTVERFIADEKSVFDSLLPVFCPIVIDFLRIATNFRARTCIADFLTRLAQESGVVFSEPK